MLRVMAELPRPLSGRFVSGKCNERQQGDSASGSPCSPPLDTLGELERTGMAPVVNGYFVPAGYPAVPSFPAGRHWHCSPHPSAAIPLVQLGKLRQGVVT